MADVVFTSFNGGEVSPDFIGRTDQAAYYTSVETMRNMIAIQTGAARSRGGTVFVQEAKRLFDGSRLRRVALVRFTFSDIDAYILEFGHQYIRFYKNRGIIVDGGSPLEIVSPYTENDLFDEEGLFQIQFAQSNDFMYLAHPTVTPQQLTRSSDIDWSITQFQPFNGPYLPENLTQQTLRYEGGVIPGNTGTLNSSTSYFTTDQIGAFILLRRTVETTPPWQTGQAYVLNNIVHNQGLYYLCTDAGTSGAEPPTHDEGSAYDGPDISTACRWQFLHAGQAVFKITGYTSSLVVDVEVVTSADTFPGFAVTTWREGAWSGRRGYPRSVQIHQQRLWWAGTFAQPLGVFASEIDQFDNYAPTDRNGLITDTTAFTRQLDNNNPIRWMLGIDKGMLVGTLAGEWLITTESLAGILTATTAQATRYSQRGAANIYPHQTGEEVVYVQVGRKRLRDVVFSLDKSTLVSTDLNIRADHILQARVTSTHWAEEPHHVMWSSLENGALAGFTFNAEERVQVQAWHSHRLGGSNAAVEYVEGIPSPTGIDDDTWLVVSRTINGEQRRYIEFMSQPNCDSEGRGCYLDSALGYDGPPTSQLGGLTHLAGETVQVRVDGKNHDDVTVSAGGEITLNIPGSLIEVGFYALRQMVLLPIEFRGQDGRPLTGRDKLPIKARVRVVDTVGGEIGIIQRDNNVSPMVPIEAEEARDEFQDLPPIEFTGLSDAVAIDGEFTVNGQVVIQQPRPQPLNVTQVVVRI